MAKRLLLALLLLLAFRVTLAQDTLVLDQLTTVNIDADAQAPSLNFTATAGQRLNIQLASITSGLFPTFTIFTTDGEILQYVGNPARIAILEAVAVIPATGSYRLEVWNADSISGQIILLVQDLSLIETIPGSSIPTPVQSDQFPTLAPATAASETNCTIAPASNLPVNVREGPSAVFRAIAALNPGQSLAVTGRDQPNDWFRVTVNGVEGWVAASVTQLEGECAALEVFAIRVPSRTPTPTNTPTPTHTPTNTPVPTATRTPTPGLQLATQVFSSGG